MRRTLSERSWSIAGKHLCTTNPTELLFQELEMFVLSVSVINGTSTMLMKTGKNVFWPMSKKPSRLTAKPCIMTLSTLLAGWKSGVARDHLVLVLSSPLTSNIWLSHCQTVPFTSPTTRLLTTCREISKDRYQACWASSLRTFLMISGAISCLERNTRVEKFQPTS